MKKFGVVQGGGEASGKSAATLKILNGGKGMIQLTNNVYRDGNFQTAFMKLYQAEINHKAYFSVKRVMDKFKQRSKEFDDADNKIKEQFLKVIIETDESGKEIKKEEWSDKKAANEAYKALYEQTFEIEVSPLFTVDINHLKFTAAEWDALQPLIGDPENLGKRV